MIRSRFQVEAKFMLVFESWKDGGGRAYKRGRMILTGSDVVISSNSKTGGSQNLLKLTVGASFAEVTVSFSMSPLMLLTKEAELDVRFRLIILPDCTQRQEVNT